MTREDAKNILEEIIKHNACAGTQDLTAKRFLEDLRFDSLSVVQMMLDIEEVFGIQLDDMEAFIEHIDTTERFVDWILEELKNIYGKID